MKDLFNSFEDFQEEQANVFNFHNKITDTIVHLLQKTGTVFIPEEDQWDYCFTYLEMEGTYTTKAVMIDPDNADKYCLIATSDDSDDEYTIDVDDINCDMIIEEKILSLVFDKYNEVEG